MTQTAQALVTIPAADVTVAEITPLRGDNLPALPARVKNGIRDLLIAFPAGSPQHSEDRTRSLQMYAEAIDGFEACVARYAITRLRLHNPRNPFPPTAQDLYELCQKTRGTWQYYLVEYFIRGRDWGYERSTLDPNAWLRRDPGRKPFQEGCYIPSDVVMAWLRERLALEYIEEELVTIPRKWFDAIPGEAFNPGQRLAVELKRAKGVDSESRRRDEEELIESLPVELRVMGREVLAREPGFHIFEEGRLLSILNSRIRAAPGT